MKPADRYDWIERWLRENKIGSQATRTDVLNADFVASYIDATGATFFGTMFGAAKCPQLGRDLAAMAKAYRLKRSRTGVEGMAGMGFPRWVWSYRIHPVHLIKGES